MAFSLKKYDIPEEIKKEIMEMYASDTEAYDAQIKELNKKSKQFADYDELKSKVSTYETEIEKIKNESKAEILNTKKQFAFDSAIKSSNVSNEKLVKKLISLDELNYDDEKGSFTDFSDKLKNICDEYGISIESTNSTTTKPTETKTEAKSEPKTNDIFKSIMKSPEMPTNAKPALPPSENKSQELSFVEKLALETKERNERNAQLSSKVTSGNDKNNAFINAFVKNASNQVKKGK